MNGGNRPSNYNSKSGRIEWVTMGCGNGKRKSLAAESGEEEEKGMLWRMNRKIAGIWELWRGRSREILKEDEGKWFA
jgi:hypothetical protein